MKTPIDCDPVEIFVSCVCRSVCLRVLYVSVYGHVCVFGYRQCTHVRMYSMHIMVWDVWLHSDMFSIVVPLKCLKVHFQ